MKIVVAGGGAAGLAAAVTAARRGADVTILEKEKICGSKIRRSGNGHCNFGNTLTEGALYHGSFSETAGKLLREEGASLSSFLSSCGILEREVRGGLYPASEEADSVYRCLLYAAEKAGVTIRNGQRVNGLRGKKGSFTVLTEDREYEADAVILSCGSYAGLPRKEDCGYALSRSAGHTVVRLLPALTGLRGKDAPYGWAGARARCAVRLEGGGRILGSSAGQVQFTGEGLSGIPVFDLSGPAARAAAEGTETSLILDLVPDRTEEELEAFLREKAERAYPGNLLTGILPGKLHPYFAGTVPGELAASLKAFRFRVLGTRDASAAQVLSGGIPASEIDTRTFESLVRPGLYLCGEMLDADGICGGYNLSFAFLSGIRAGESAS